MGFPVRHRHGGAGEVATGEGIAADDTRPAAGDEALRPATDARTDRERQVRRATIVALLAVYPRESAGQWGFGQAAAMQLVRDRVPVGETVCVDTATISYWTYEQFIA